MEALSDLSNFGQAFNRTVWNPGRERKVSIREIKKKDWVHRACTQSSETFYHKISPLEKKMNLILYRKFLQQAP